MKAAFCKRFGRAVFMPPAPPAEDPFFEDVVLLLHMDGADTSTTFIDSSSNGLTGTPTSATISTAQSVFGGASGRFNSGTLVFSDADLAINAESAFTVEGWFRVDDISVIRGIFYSGNIGSNNHRCQFQVNPAGYTNFYLQGGGSGLSIESDPGIIEVDTWYHFAAVKDGTAYRAYINGELVASNTYGSSISGNSTFRVGDTRSGGGSLPMLGYIDDFRVTAGVARYNANFTPPSAPYPDVGVAAVESIWVGAVE